MDETLEKKIEDHTKRVYTACQKDFDDQMPDWDNLSLFAKKAWLSSQKLWFQMMRVTDAYSGKRFVEDDWKPSVGQTLDDLKKKYTGEIRTTYDTDIIGGKPNVKNVDFEWVSGNNYVIVYNTFLEDAESHYAAFDGKTLTLMGTKHEYTLLLNEDVPELDVKVFVQVGSKIKTT